MIISFGCENCGRRYKVDDSRIGETAKCKDCGAEIRVPDPETHVEPQDPEAAFSPGGSQLHVHEARTKDFETAIGDEASIEAISNHIESHVGKVDVVFHELVSDLVHIDVHVVAPSEERPFYTLVTSGMSDRPMTVPDELHEHRFAELVISLPEDWTLSEDEFKDEANYWPIRLIKTLARLPHEYDTWLGFGHTVPNADPPEPYASNTGFSCALVGIPLLVDEEFCTLELPNKRINFYSIVPMYDEETEFKLEHGLDQLLNKFDKYEVCELLDLERRNVVKRRWGLF